MALYNLLNLMAGIHERHVYLIILFIFILKYTI
jgi:hypothetical protein